MEMKKELIIEQRDEVTGLIKKINPLNKKNLTKEEMDNIFNCDEMTANERSN